jgi:hypothetical protein
MEDGRPKTGVGRWKTEDRRRKSEDRTGHFDPGGSGQASSVAGTPSPEQQTAAVAVGSSRGSGQDFEHETSNQQPTTSNDKRQTQNAKT